MSDITNVSEWLAVQYKRTNIDALLTLVATVADIQLLAIFKQFSDRNSILIADGVWLDFIGARLNSPRPSIIQGQNVFGFDGNGVGFDQAPFTAGIEDGVAIIDSQYRMYLLARARQLITNGTLQDFIDILLLVFDDVLYFDNQDMSAIVQIISTLPSELIDVLIEDGVVPKAAGVRLHIQRNNPDLSFFGFDGVGVGFDQATFIEQFGDI